jgi:hypothetical protein
MEYCDQPYRLRNKSGMLDSEIFGRVSVRPNCLWCYDVISIRDKEC